MGPGGREAPKLGKILTDPAVRVRYRKLPGAGAGAGRRRRLSRNFLEGHLEKFPQRALSGNLAIIHTTTDSPWLQHRQHGEMRPMRRNWTVEMCVYVYPIALY